jgi:hypothetical protein
MAHERNDQSRNVAWNQQHAFLLCPSIPKKGGQEARSEPSIQECIARYRENRMEDTGRMLETGHPQEPALNAVRGALTSGGRNVTPNQRQANFVSAPRHQGREAGGIAPGKRGPNEAGMCPEINRIIASPLYQGFGHLFSLPLSFSSLNTEDMDYPQRPPCFVFVGHRAHKVNPGPEFSEEASREEYPTCRSGGVPAAPPL